MDPRYCSIVWLRRPASAFYKIDPLGLNLVSAAIVLWNTVYLERAIQTIKDRGETVDENLLQHLSPLGWEHINLTGDYHWETSPTLGPDQFRPLRTVNMTSPQPLSVL